MTQFNLRFFPNFARQKEAFLAQKTVPSLELPPRLNSTLDSISDSRHWDSLENITPMRLWISCLQAVSTFLLQAIGIAFLGACATILSSLAAMELLKSNHSFTAFFIFSIGFFIMNCAYHFSTFKNGKIRAWASLTAETHLLSLISRKLLRISSFASHSTSSGSLKTLITSDTKAIGEFLDNFVRNFIPALITIILTTPVLYYFSGKAGLLGMAVMILILPISLGLNRFSTHFQNKGLHILDSLTSLLGEWVKNVRLVRYLSWDELFIDEIMICVRKYLRVASTQHFILCIIVGFSVSWWMIAMLSVFIHAKISNSNLDILNFFETLWLLTFVANYVTHLPNTVRLYSLAAPSIQRITNLLSKEEQDRSFKKMNSTDTKMTPFDPKKAIKLRFKNVSFAFPNGELAIRNLDFELDLRKKVAIVGEVGAGKSTFLKLTLGAFPPTHGQIEVEFENGERHDLWDQETYYELRSQIAYVPQEAFISSDFLSVNISLDPQYSEPEIMNAAYWAELESDLQSFPQGIYQELGENGINLSGGQKQRLNLARAFYSRRNYFVLDDPLSAVDTKTETALMNSLLNQESGFVLVTHRTQEIMRVETVLVMKNGGFIESGDPKVLVSQPESHFARVLSAYEGEAALV